VRVFRKSDMSSRDKRGQTVVEFALVSVFFIFMLILTFNAVLAFTVHQYFSYVTFMSARAYQAAGDTPQDSALRARETMKRLIPGLPLSQSALSSMNFSFTFDLFGKELAVVDSVVIPSPDDQVFGMANPASPIQINFRVPLVQFPISQELQQQFAFISLKSESYLGREVSRSEVKKYFSSFFNAWLVPGVSAGNIVSGYSEYMEDNGW